MADSIDQEYLRGFVEGHEGDHCDLENPGRGLGEERRHTLFDLLSRLSSA